MDYDDFLRRLPKVELHIHFNGTLRPATVIELARKNAVALPTDDPRKLYHHPWTRFFKMLTLVSQTLVDRDDFSRTTYETLEDAAKRSNIRYMEMFVNPTLFRPSVSYETMLDGMIDGIRAAEVDYRIRCRLIPSIFRTESPEQGVQFVEKVLATRQDEVIGIGLDGPEALGEPEKFAEAYAIAAQGGLHRTAHACEDAPPRNVTACLDVLKCERLDHGYFILEDDDVVRRARDDGIYFTVIPRGFAKYLSMPHHLIKEMVKRGLKVTLASDDPTMHNTDLVAEYIDAAVAFNWGPAMMREICLNGVEASWLDGDEKRRLRREFEDEINILESEGLENLPPDFVPYWRERWWHASLAPSGS